MLFKFPAYALHNFFITFFYPNGTIKKQQPEREVKDE